MNKGENAFSLIGSKSIGNSVIFFFLFSEA